MYWNYRIVEQSCPATKEKYFTVCEVYYSDKNKIQGWAPLSGLVADSELELFDMLKTMQSDLKKHSTLVKMKEDKLKERKK